MLSLLLYKVSCVKMHNNDNLYGEWVGENLNYSVKLTFSYGGLCVLEIKKGLSKEVSTHSGLFNLNYSKKPIPLSITNIKETNTPLHTIIKFVGNNKIKIEKFSTQWKLRPIAFNNETEIVLHRKS